MPKTIEAIPVGKAFAKLYVLHATLWSTRVKDGTVIGQYRVNYYDKSTETIPIVLGEDVRDLWSEVHPKTATRGVVGWVGSNETVKKLNRGLRLYVGMWRNPHPDRQVATIDYVSTLTDAAPFCVAMTVEAAFEPAGDEEAAPAEVEAPDPSDKKQTSTSENSHQDR